MSRRISDIEARFGEVEKLVLPNFEREKRLLNATAEFYSEQEKLEIEGLSPLLAKLGGDAKSLKEFFAAQQRVAIERVKAVTPLLQLTEGEILNFEKIKRATILIDPCSLIPHGSSVWKCVFLAGSSGSTHWETADASDSCTCTPATADNHIEARVEAYGQGQRGWRCATTEGWFCFDVPARSAATNVDVQVYLNLHGFYIVRKSTGSANFALTIKAEGFQYGYSWNSKSLTVLNVSNDAMARYDSPQFLDFTMPVGADPFTVRVSAKLTATAKTGGAFAVGDFGTGAGNYIEVVYCNTYG